MRVRLPGPPVVTGSGLFLAVDLLGQGLQLGNRLVGLDSHQAVMIRSNTASGSPVMVAVLTTDIIRSCRASACADRAGWPEQAAAPNSMPTRDTKPRAFIASRGCS